MAKVTVERKEVEVTLVLSEDEALALLALVGCIKSGNQPLNNVYKALHDGISPVVPSIWKYRVKGGPLIEVVAQAT